MENIVRIGGRPGMGAPLTAATFMTAHHKAATFETAPQKVARLRPATFMTAPLMAAPHQAATFMTTPLMTATIVAATVIATALLVGSPARAGSPGPSVRLAPAKTPLTLLLVVDRSGSMTGALMEHTRGASQGLVRRLGPNDWVGLIAFDSAAQLILAPQARGDGKEAIRAIGKVQPRGGTAYGPALALAATVLAKHPGPQGGRRHILFLSDGQSPLQGVLDQVRALRKAGVTFTTVALGTSADKTFLGQMADAGGGRAYVAVDGKVLGALLAKELALLRR